MRPRGTVLVALALVVSSCTAGSDVATTSPDPTTSTTTTSQPSLTTTSTTSTTLAPNPLTNRRISASTLRRMPLVDLPAPFGVFATSGIRDESNAIAAQRSPERLDEESDIVRFGRVDGYRTVHQPGLLVAKSAIAVDTWVALFETDAGASGYLGDFGDDVIKGLDVGHGGALRVVEASDFVVDELGDEAIGLVATESASGATTAYYETVIAFRVGRIVGFVAILRDEQSDVRIPALKLASSLRERIEGVLDGTVRDDLGPVAGALVAYSFSYEQELSEEYLAVVYPDEPPTFGDGETPPPGDDQPPPDNGSDPPPGDEEPPLDDGSTSSTSSTTTTTLLVPTTSISVVESSGFVVGSDLDCTLRFVGAASALDVHYVLRSDDVWRSTSVAGLGEEDEPPQYERVDPDDELLDSDLIYCPGWSPLLDESGLDAVVTPGAGTTETLGTTTAERFDLGAEQLATIGLLPADSRNVTVDAFTVWIGGEGPWVLAVDLALGGTSDAMEAAFGSGFYPGSDVSIRVHFSIAALNDPRLVVVPPE